MTEADVLRSFTTALVRDVGGEARDDGTLLWLTIPEAVQPLLDLPAQACVTFDPERIGEFDAELVAPGSYLLEVSSPGNNRPLVTEGHYQRFAGQEARVAVERPGAERMTYTGRIRSCINGILTLDTDGGEVVVALREIVRANLINQEYKIDKKRDKDRRPPSWRRGES